LKFLAQGNNGAFDEGSNSGLTGISLSFLFQANTGKPLLLRLNNIKPGLLLKSPIVCPKHRISK